MIGTCDMLLSVFERKMDREAVGRLADGQQLCRKMAVVLYARIKSLM